MPDKAYALHSPAVVGAAPNRGGKAAAASHKQNVGGNRSATFIDSRRR